MKKWYETLFENYSKSYDKEDFVSGTLGECDFIEAEAGFDKAIKILDIGCGTGRHAIELTKRGYSVTGVDLSDDQLKRATEKASAEGLNIDFIKMDARYLVFRNEFDLALMICEGAFPLMETDEMNFQILQGAARALKKGGKLIFTTLNGLFPLFNSVKDFMEKNPGAGNAQYKGLSFDLMTFRDHNMTIIEDDNGNKRELECNERYYIPPEITWLLKSVGFVQIEIFGARLGAFSRNHKLTANDFEMLVVAGK